MKTKISVIVLICLSLLAFTLPGFAKKPSNGKVPGKPFVHLQQQIDSLKQITQLGQQQINDLQQEVADLTMELDVIKQDGAYGYKCCEISQGFDG